MSNEKPKSENEKTSETPEHQEDKTQKEIGGYADMNKPEPTRYGDWETNGRCTDF